MSRVVGVHGIGNFRYFSRNGRAGDTAARAIGSDWTQWLDEPVTVAYYSQHLHRGTPQGSPDQVVTALEPAEQDCFLAWADLLRPVPQVAHGPRTARVRQAADWVTRTFGRSACLAAAVFCREVHTYLSAPDSPRRTAAREQVAEVIERERPQVVVAHSLGSVVAYEALWTDCRHRVERLVTIGSPLAMPSVVLDRLLPEVSDGRGARPPGVVEWVNLADVGDLVAVPRGGLAARFDGVADRGEIAIGVWDFHTVRAYLSHPEVRASLRLS